MNIQSLKDVRIWKLMSDGENGDILGSKTISV